MIEKYILDFLVSIHVLIWIYLIIGGLISDDQCNIILFYALPAVYLIHLLPIHLLSTAKKLLIRSNKKEFEVDEKNNNVETIAEEYENKNIIWYIFSGITKMFTHSFQNPLSPQGLLILGFISNLYIKKYYWHTI